MEKLTAAQQQQVKKMSDERLRVKLLMAGYAEEAVTAYDREALIAKYVELQIISYRQYDPEIERQKLQFEQRKWEAEIEERKRREQAEIEERKRKEEIEQKRWEADQKRWEAEMEEKKRKEELEEKRRV